MRVINTTAQSVPVVTGPGGTPYSRSEHFIISTATVSGSGAAFTPSTSHALVIDQITWLGDVSTGQALFGAVNCTTGGNNVNYWFQVPHFAADAGTAGQDAIGGAIPLHIYCDANTTVTVSATRSDSSNAGVFNYGNNYTLSGYLLP